MVTRVVSWAERTIWWHVYPLGFTGAEKAALAPGEPVRHRLRQLAGWLDYAVELGCSGLLLGPIFAAETHDVAGFAVAETPDPGARPADPALVPGHGWVILSS
jgi:hypothetical protein